MTQDFLSIAELTRDDVEKLLSLTERLREDKTAKPLAGKTVAMIFQKPSLRTRVSFEVGVVQLGGHPIVLSNEGIGIGTRESAQDIGNILSRFNDAIVARLFDHQILLDLAHYASIPVINALTDLSHPCQIMSDLYTLQQHGRLQENISITYIGDGNNIVNSWLELAGILPLRLTLSVPHGYEPDKQIFDEAVKKGISSIQIVRDPKEAIKTADVIYTDTWTSMGQEQERNKRLFDFWTYQINASLMKYAKSDAIVMHCLPAHRGEEITNEILDGKISVVIDQAENRLHMQKAILASLLRTT
ncbi:MAG: ornithine carbamoyltransferase [Bacteroidetes bacterium]|nr:ornithine carbamoyltransferase [Bacteroidota bacterium]